MRLLSRRRHELELEVEHLGLAAMRHLVASSPPEGPQSALRSNRLAAGCGGVMHEPSSDSPVCKTSRACARADRVQVQ